MGSFADGEGVEEEEDGDAKKNERDCRTERNIVSPFGSAVALASRDYAFSTSAWDPFYENN